ncbi:MAG: dephospho-CoA kinase [Ruminococcus sp.]|nr:dephospho-CoA kinase [Ruminococcus sp.]
MNRPKLIGLTGQSGAGKSTAAALFAANGFTVINADDLVRAVYETNPACLKAVAASFGEDILFPDGTLNRRLLASRAFADKESTALLGALVHPFVIAETLKILKTVSGMAVFDAPQLFESNIDVVCDVIVSITAAEDVRLQRILARDKLTVARARERMDAQYSEAFFREHADFVIENNGDSASFAARLLPVIENIRTGVM